MKILVTGANGRVGSKVVEQLLARGVQLRALVRDRIKANFPPMVEVVEGDFLEPDSLRPALAGITSVFLLNAVAGDEVTQALNVLNLIQEAGVRRLVYLSVMHSDRYVNVPHFAGKFAVERMIEQMGISATILHPAYFMENDVRIQQVVSDFGVYPMPIGDIGIAMIDVGDLAAVAAEELVRRSQGPETLPL
ncbi:MAG TPA: NmrA family NAD(P)-binding protein, partial [Cellvibrionaceae bacterium]|nr:NmrA family NAD(P)-binding protein [Cellvibrionaceae bacterium]